LQQETSKETSAKPASPKEATTTKQDSKATAPVEKNVEVPNTIPAPPAPVKKQPDTKAPVTTEQIDPPAKKTTVPDEASEPAAAAKVTPPPTLMAKKPNAMLAMKKSKPVVDDSESSYDEDFD